ncbi:MAG: FAD-binding protein [Deltaproteobacteria bacterium]|nr:FAD-binding protein [Deltaproteobacteria bacterium]
MISKQALRKLSRILGPEAISTCRDVLDHYGTDATKLAYSPDAVAFPGHIREIADILRLANHEGFPVVPRGAGSGKSGGALPVQGGLILAMDRFDRILEIDESNHIAKVESGVITARLQEEVEKVGLFYPPDPASIHISTIGGNVAECAGGLRAVKYGVTRDYVLGLTVVLPTGNIIKTGVETAKGVVGYDLTRLLIGSEGTLAVIVGVTLRLIPKPVFTRSMMVFFKDPCTTVKAVSEIMRSKVVPTALEFMDRNCIECVRNEIGLSIPKSTGALLLIELDGDRALTRRETDTVKEICSQMGAIDFQAASTKKKRERLWEARRNVSPAVYKLKPDKVSEDVVVPRNRMADLVSYVNRLSQKYGLPMPVYGHAGDGNIHVNMMLDKKNPDELTKVDKAVRELFQKVLDMKGTLSGEHGIGITKAPYLSMEISKPAQELMIRVKKAFDPNGILNPGKIFPQRI